jgi:Cysteine rich repeat
MIRTSGRVAALWAIVASTIVASALPAFSQAPTDAQRSAIRSACRSDYIAHCSSVPPGGMASLQCLQKNMSSLSSSCQTAVRAVEAPAEPKAEAKPEPKAESKTESKTEAKPQDKSEAKRESAPPASSAAPAEKPAAEAAPAPKAAASAPAKKPSSAQVAAIRSACRSDYMAHCASVPTGGAAALSCLKQNKSKLSAGCQQAVNAAGGGASSRGSAAAPAEGGAPAPGAATDAATVASPAVAPMVLRPMRPREVLFVLRSACGGDVRALCADVPPGGGRIVQCLAAQAASLSTECHNVLGSFAQ